MKRPWILVPWLVLLTTAPTVSRASRPPSLEARQRTARRALKQLRHAHPHVRAEAARALERVIFAVCDEALPVVGPLVTRDPDVNVRLRSVILAGRIAWAGNKAEAEALLKAALADKSTDVVTQARIMLEPDQDRIGGLALGRRALRAAGVKRPASFVRRVRSKPPRQEINRPKLRRAATSVLPQLIRLLRHRASTVRRGAAWLLGQTGRRARSAVPALLRALRDKDPRVSAAAAGALDQLTPLTGWATGRVVAALQTVYWRTRAALATVLAKSGLKRPAVGRALTRLLRDEIDSVASSAAWALGQRLAKAGGATRTQLVDALSRAVKDGGGLTKVMAIDALGTVIEHPPQGGLPVVEQLAHPVPRVREVAMWYVGKLGKRTSPRAVPLLVRLLDDERSRRAAIGALGSVGPAAAAAVPRLIELLADKDHSIRGYAVVTLGKIGPAASRAVPALIEALKKRTANRDWLRKALEAIGTDQARKALSE